MNAGNKPEPVLRVERKHPDCPSTYHLTLFSRGELNQGDHGIEPERRIAMESHIDGCEHCQAKLGQLAEAGRDKTLPASLRTSSGFGGRPLIWSAALGTALCAVVALFVVQPPSAENGDVLAKGAVEVLVTVTRAEHLVCDSRPVNALPPLESGDALQIRVSGGQGHYAVLRIVGAAPETVYEGVVPASGYLPDALSYVPGQATELELRVCGMGATPPADTSTCPHWHFKL